MISKEHKEALLGNDEAKRLQTMQSLDRLDSEDMDFLVRTAFNFDRGYLEKVIDRIAKVNNEKSACLISTILFALIEETQEPIRVKCIDALSQNSTYIATQVLINVAKNQRFYKIQCLAVKRLGLRKKEVEVLSILHNIIEEEKYLPSSEAGKQPPHILILSAFEALSSDSLRNLESALSILDKITDPSSGGVYIEYGVKYLARTGLNSLVDSVLDKIEEYEADRKIVFPLMRLLKDLKHKKIQRNRIHKLIERILPTIDQNQQLNNDLALIMKATVDENLLDIVSAATCGWDLNMPAGSLIIEILNMVPKNSPRTVDALLRYAGTGQWNTNRNRVFPNLNDCYLDQPIYVIRKTFENKNPTYIQCRDYLRGQQNTDENRESLITNITRSIEASVKESHEDKEKLNGYIHIYFNELQIVLAPLFKSEISDRAWRVCTRNCLYPLTKISTEIGSAKRKSLDEGLKTLISGFLGNSRTGQRFIERTADEWLASRTRTFSKYILIGGCSFDEHRSKIIEILITRASDCFHKGNNATTNEVWFQKWVSKEIVGDWKQECKGILVEHLTKNDAFNEWVYDTLQEHELLDASIIAAGLTSRLSESYEMKLLGDLIENYTSKEEGLLLQKIRNGRSPKVRAKAVETAGRIFDYHERDQCPNSVLHAIHEKLSEHREVRETAYVSLGLICSAQSIDHLLGARQKDKTLKSVIEKCLDNLFEKFSKAKPNESDVEKTIEWIRTIGKLGDPRGFQLLKNYVDPSTYHRDERVRLASIQALGKLGSSKDIPLLESLKETESHMPEFVQEIDRAIAQISNLGDFDILDIMQKLTEGNKVFTDPTLDLTRIFGNKSSLIKNQCFKAYKAWHDEDYSLYVTRLDSVCDLVSKRIFDVFKDEIFVDEKQHISVRTSQNTDTRYGFIKAHFDRTIGSCFSTVHALRVQADIAHPEDSRTEEPRAELTLEDGELAKDNFISAITKSIDKLKSKLLMLRE